MVSNEAEQMHLSGLTVEDVMNLEEEALDLLLENIQVEIEKNRINLEQSLENYGKKWEALR